MASFRRQDYSPAVAVVPTDPINPDTQTADTIILMRGIVRQSLSLPIVRSTLALATQGISRCHRYRDELATAIFHWIKSNITFVNDDKLVTAMLGDSFSRNIEGEDFLITPQALLASTNPAGDCDDFAMLGATLLMASGVPARFVTVAADKDYPNVFSHVYLEFLDSNNCWRGFDASHGNYIGWYYPYATRKMTWDI